MRKRFIKLREFMRVGLAQALAPQLMQTYQQHQTQGAYSPAASQAATTRA